MADLEFQTGAPILRDCCANLLFRKIFAVNYMVIKKISDLACVPSNPVGSAREGHCCQFVFASSVLSVMSVNGFPLIIMSAHAQCSICTCSVEGIPSLVCLHLLSVTLQTCGDVYKQMMFTLHTNEGRTYTEHVQRY